MTDETGWEDLARLELEYAGVHEAVEAASSRLESARAELDRLRAEVDRAEAEQEREHARVEAARTEDIERLDTALADLMRLSQGRYVAELEVEAARAEVEALEEEAAGQQTLVADLEARVAEAKVRRQQLEAERVLVERSATHEANRLRVAKARLNRLHGEGRELEGATGALAEAASVIDAAALAAEAEGEMLPSEPGTGFVPAQPDRASADERVLVGAGAPVPAEDRAATDRTATAQTARAVSASLVDRIHLPALSKISWSSNASWNAAFAILSVMVVLLGLKTLTSDPSATQAFCASAPQLDVAAARSQLADLAKGAKPGSAYSTFEEGRYAYPTTSEVDPEVRLAAAQLEAAHAAVAERKGRTTSPAQLRRLGQEVVDADATLRSVCQEM